MLRYTILCCMRPKFCASMIKHRSQSKFSIFLTTVFLTFRESKLKFRTVIFNKMNVLFLITLEIISTSSILVDGK